jgi:hypothetical protein
LNELVASVFESFLSELVASVSKEKLNQRRRWLSPAARVARFFLVKQTKTGENLPNNHKIYPTAIKCTKLQQIIPTFPLPRTSKICPNWDFWYEKIPSGNTGRHSGHENEFSITARITLPLRSRLKRFKIIFCALFVFVGVGVGVGCKCAGGCVHAFSSHCHGLMLPAVDVCWKNEYFQKNLAPSKFVCSRNCKFPKLPTTPSLKSKETREEN